MTDGRLVYFSNLAQYPDSAAGHRPSFGPLFEHLTDDEVRWLIDDVGLTDVGGVRTSADQMVHQASVFRENEPDLRIWSQYSLDEMRNRPWIPENAQRRHRIRSGKLQKGQVFATWYVIALANYGRIRLPLGFLRENTAPWTERWPADKQALVNESMLAEAFDWWHNRLQKGRSTAKDVTRMLWRLVLWVGEPLSTAHRQLDQFEELVRSTESVGRYMSRSIPKLRLLLANQFEGVSVRSPFVNRPTKKLNTDKPAIRRASELYSQHLKIAGGAPTTAQEKRLNVIRFLGWVDDAHPEIECLTELERVHIKEFIYSYLDQDYKTPEGTPVSARIKNKHVYHVREFFEWLSANHPELAPKGRLFTPFDAERVFRAIPKRIEQMEAEMLFRAIGQLEEHMWLREKMVLLLLAETGQRLHEVRHLAYNPLRRAKTKSGFEIVFHKRKGQGAFPVSATPLAVQYVRKCQECFRDYTATIPSELDGRDIRRLIPGRTGRSILGAKQVYAALNQAQFRAGLLDAGGDPKYTPHDLRRIYVSGLLAEGLAEHEIAKLVGHESLSSLLPYEGNNPKALDVYRKAAESGVLIGQPVEEGSVVSGLTMLEEELLKQLQDLDVRKRHRENLSIAARNESATWPLMTGTCTANGALTCFSDDLTCLGCSKLKDVKVDKVDDYLKRVFRQEWLRDKHGIKVPLPVDEDTMLCYGDGTFLDPRLEVRITRIRENVYINQIGMTDEQALAHITMLRDLVLPRRGRPKKRGT